MPKTRQQKEQVIKQTTDELQNAKSVVFSTFSKIPVKADQELRKNLHEQNVSYAVVKKTLLRKILEKLGYGFENIDNLQGNISVAISANDEVAPAKTISQFMKDNKGINFVGGILENKWIDENKIKELAKLPSKDELIAKTVGSIKAPINGLVNVMAGNLRGLVNVLNLIKESKN